MKALAVLGLLLSSYALYVKWKVSRSDNYKPLCDINPHISCTRAFTNKYGNIAYFPNPLYGIFFYITVFILDLFRYKRYLFYLLILSVSGSLILAYISYFKQRNFCLVCTGIYLVNILLLAFNLNK